MTRLLLLLATALAALVSVQSARTGGPDANVDLGSGRPFRALSWAQQADTGGSGAYYGQHGERGCFPKPSPTINTDCALPRARRWDPLWWCALGISVAEGEAPGVRRTRSRIGHCARSSTLTCEQVDHLPQVGGSQDERAWRGGSASWPVRSNGLRPLRRVTNEDSNV